MTSPTPSLTLTNTETLSNNDNASQDLESGIKQPTSTKTGTGKSTRSIAELDVNEEDEGNAQFFLALMYER